MYPTTPRRLACAALGLVALATATACEGDDDSMSTAACDAYTAMHAAMFGDPAAMGPAVTALADELPSSLKDEAGVLAGAADDPAAMDDPTVNAALQSVGDAAYDGCETDTRLDVTGVDYAFGDLPDEIDAGRVAIRFTNDSQTDEPHELVLAVGANGEPVAELAELPIEELFAKARPVAVAFTDVPDTHATTFADLEPGEYLVICTLPVGGFTEGQEGPPADPHSAHGMVATLTVV